MKMHHWSVNIAGYDDSAPVLVHASNDGCVYDFEWSTSEACELKHFSGDNCRISGQGETH